MCSFRLHLLFLHILVVSRCHE